MAKLGDFFPESNKREHIARKLKPGQVLHLFCEFTTPPKEKYLVLACPDGKCLLFVVNSRISPFAQKRPNLLSCQVKLAVSDYDFLDHDSWADCAEVHVVDKSEIEAQLLQDIGRIKGELTPTTKAQIQTVVQQTNKISPKHKKMILGALK